MTLAEKFSKIRSLRSRVALLSASATSQVREAYHGASSDPEVMFDGVISIYLLTKAEGAMREVDALLAEIEATFEA